jgi:hypothetical protein
MNGSDNRAESGELFGGERVMDAVSTCAASSKTLDRKDLSKYVGSAPRRFWRGESLSFLPRGRSMSLRFFHIVVEFPRHSW